MVRRPASLDLDAIGRLIDAAGHSPRHGARNSLVVRLMYGHALRLKEMVELTWGQLDLFHGKLRVQRGRPDKLIVRNLSNGELSALREMREDTSNKGRDDAVFVSNRGEALTPDGMRKILAAAAKRAKISQPAGPRVIRRSAGIRVGTVTGSVDAVQSLMGVGMRASVVPVIPVTKQKRQSDPWV